MDTNPAPTPYGTPDAPRLAVRGEAHLEADPEIARITITVHARGADRRDTLDDLTRRNTHTLDLIKTYGDAIENIETGAFSISPELTRHGRAERVRAYRGRVHITVELTDFTALGELTTRLADLELTHVEGPWWALRPDSPTHRHARQQAVREAVQRAREYAEALPYT
ncbi:SIMPL domain-containing protein, partial [Streptomyces alfalfae]